MFKQCAIMDNIADSFVIREMNFLLLIMTENDSFSRLYMSRIYWFFTHKHTNKSRLPYSVFSYDTDTLIMSELMRKIIQYLFVAKRFSDIFELEDFSSELSFFHRQSKLCLFSEYRIFQVIITFIDMFKSRRSGIGFGLSSTWGSLDPAQFFSV